jgi:hypothetical protein
MSETVAQPRDRRLRGRSIAVVILVLVLVGVGIVVVRHRSNNKPGTGPQASGSYKVVGNKIIGPTGAQFVPEGITIFGLSEQNWQSNVSTDEQKIAAIAGFWHGNTVRVQVAPTDLSGADGAAFLSAVNKEVSYSLSLGLDVWISAQYEHTSDISMPDQSTLAFWQKVAAIYKSNPRVWFDLFNEPRLSLGSKSQAALWNIWQNGGTHRGYVGMQQLVNAIRSTGAMNIILAEGMEFARSLALLPSHVLQGSNIVYEVHGYFVNPGFNTAASWPANWGNLSSRFAIVVGEWSEFESQTHDCVSDPRTLVPEFLDYLSSHDIGLIAWQLGPGILINGTNLRDPTTFSPTTPYKCSDGVKAANQQGAGAMVLAYFSKYSHPVPGISG